MEAESNKQIKIAPGNSSRALRYDGASGMCEGILDLSMDDRIIRAELEPGYLSISVRLVGHEVAYGNWVMEKNMTLPQILCFVELKALQVMQNG